MAPSNAWLRSLRITSISILLYITHQGVLSSDQGAAKDYCLNERFSPKCAKNEAIFVTAATYGRMRIGRCITAKEVEAHRLTVGDDPRYLGCSEDVLSIMDRKCSGKTECDVRVIDLAHENVAPCFPGLFGYLEVGYDCIAVADEERSCSVTASVVPSHIIGFSDESQRICGTTRQPWIVEAPIGQKISISLLDFSAPQSGETKEHIKQSCRSYGVIMDKGSKRNVSICGNGADRESDLYTSSGNALEIVFNTERLKNNATAVQKFMLRIEAVGCVDLIPPEDAWLKRSDDSIVIGCYSSRQTWHLHCEGEKWIGVFGNCSHGQEPDTIMESQPKTETWSNEQILTMVAVGGFTLTICLAVLCTGIICLRRYSTQSKKKQDYRTLNFSTARHQIESRTASDTTENSTRVLATQETPTYAVYFGESGINAADNFITHNNNPSVRI